MYPLDLRIWLNHFEYHAGHPRSVPPGLPDLLTPAERQRIARSIATFQLGEQSEGGTLLRAAERCARARAVPALVRITELFICEEQHHAALLRGFMQCHAIALKSRDWTDRVFRRVRRLAGLELYLRVLICAELIGVVYYRALGSATGCKRLQMLCRMLVADERAHIGFESHLLLALETGRPAVLRALMRWAHRAFFVCTAGVVWLTHRPVLRHSGFSARGFLRVCLAQYSFYLEPVTPRWRSKNLTTT
jgi:hypothetical protein